MRAFIRHIGIVDHNDRIHAVSFGPGVNVVTGKSSTGKSALIEIFDYCFGSSDFTVPDGVITEHAETYFTVICVKKTNLVLARKRDSRNAFIKEELDESTVMEAQTFRDTYFSKDYFIPIADYKKELGRYFGLQITDVDVSLEERRYRGNRKSPTPSIRSFASFMLQHQNLVANKHAIFYRFDEKEKREQTIEHLKIFVGFADQTYFLKSQELHSLQAEQRSIELQIPRAAEVRKKAQENLHRALTEYSAISGAALEIESVEDVLRNPMRALENLRKVKVTVVPLSDEHVKQRQECEHEKSRLIGGLRKSQQKLASIRSSISFAKDYIRDADAVSVPSEAELHASECPFCNTHHATVEREANRLNQAIEWLNEELRRSPYLIESFEEEGQKIIRDIELHRQSLRVVDEKIAIIEKQIADLENYRTQYELALKAKLQVEAVLEQMLDQRDKQVDERLADLKKKIEELKHFLKQHYNIDARLKQAEDSIQAIMSDLGERFEFEESYRPINLRFSLDTFDLWHEAADRKVFLRSMGSGANWLYCHLTLFLALHRYFCSLGDACCIPSILFLDQPSQVYFPSVLDTGTEFDAAGLAKIEGEARKRSVDEDIQAVENLYSQLVRFCKETLAATGIEPQIIVTDHADNLQLEGGVEFESLVIGRRWRTRGFIELEKKES